jgi:hypothetical protein
MARSGGVFPRVDTQCNIKGYKLISEREGAYHEVILLQDV